MIGLKNNYNSITRFYILRFVEEFMEFFPGFLTKEELISRIDLSLKQNILFRKLENDVVGMYSPSDGFIACNQLLDDKRMDSVLFHEFLHAITSKYQSHKCDYHLSYVYGGEKFLESIVSLMETKFHNKKYGESKSRITGYISDYAEQLEKIFGEDFLKLFVRNYTDISSLFFKTENNQNTSFVSCMLKKICYNVNELHNCINYSSNYEKIEYTNFCLEKDIALVLRSYLINSNLSEEEKLNKINSLFMSQSFPNLDIYIDMINSCCKNRELLSRYKNLESIYKIYNGYTYGSVHLSNKISKFLAMKLFGFNNFIDDKNYEDSAIKPFFENQIYYTSMIDAIYQRDLDVSSVSSNDFASINNPKNLSSMILYDRLKYGKDISTCYDNFSCVSKFDTGEWTYFIENNDGKTKVYKPCDVIYLVTLFLLSGKYNVVKSLVNLSKSDINTIYYPVTVDGEINFPNDEENIKLIYEKDDRIILEEYDDDKKIKINSFLSDDSNVLKSMVLSQYSVKRR